MLKHVTVIAVIAIVAASFWASLSSKIAKAAITSVSVSCDSPIRRTQTSQCTATVTGTGNPSQEVTWSMVSGEGSIASGGLYTAPNNQTVARVMATSVEDPTKSGTGKITVDAAQPQAGTIVVVSEDENGNPLSSSWVFSGPPDGPCEVSACSGSQATYAGEPIGNYTIIATAPAGYTFLSYNPLQSQTLEKNDTITFTVKWAPRGDMLTVNIVGSGRVTSNPEGVDCISTCSQGFPYDTEVTLTASPGLGYVFSSWSDDCSGSGSCSVTMTTDHLVTATFIPDSSCPGLGVPPCIPPPDCTFTPNPTTVTIPASSILTYSCTNVTSCSNITDQFGVDYGPVNVDVTHSTADGTVTVAPNKNTMYTFTCHGAYNDPGYIENAKVQVTVKNPGRTECLPGSSSCP